MRWSASLALLALAPACSWAAREPGERTVGRVELEGGAAIAVPDTVRAGAPFEVRVRTRGGGCVVQGDTEVRVSGLRAEVTPWDLDRTDPERPFCTKELRLFEHVGRVRFDQPGEATVVVRVRRDTGAAVVAIERVVVVG